MKKLRKKRINIFTRWALKIRGCSDAKNNAADKSQIEGYERYYYTPFIGEQIWKFISIAEEEFSKIRDTLSKFNQTINDLNHDSDARFQKAGQDVSDLKREIDRNNKNPKTPQTKAINDALNADITKIERVARIDIQEINGKGNKNENDANKLIENYNLSFNEGLSNCVERLTIYWASLYMKHRKMDTEMKINAQLPKREELLKMCNSINPATGHNVAHYNILALDEIEKIKDQT
jgi:hypothetical protein